MRPPVCPRGRSRLALPPGDGVSDAAGAPAASQPGHAPRASSRMFSIVISGREIVRWPRYVELYLGLILETSQGSSFVTRRASAHLAPASKSERSARRVPDDLIPA